MANEETKIPQFFPDFRITDSLELIRLQDGTCNDINDYAKVDNHNGRKRVTVSGCLHERTRLNKVVLVHNVRLEILSCTTVRIEVCFNQVRA